jgi:hypothetical protein
MLSGGMAHANERFSFCKTKEKIEKTQGEADKNTLLILGGFSQALCNR